MKDSNIKINLNDKIAFLKSKQAKDLMVLRHQYYTTIDSFKPLNLIKSVTHEFIASPYLKSNLINGAIGLGTNYLSKRLFNVNAINPIKRILGKVLKLALNKIVGKNRRKSSDID